MSGTYLNVRVAFSQDIEIEDSRLFPNTYVSDKLKNVFKYEYELRNMREIFVSTAKVIPVIFFCFFSVESNYKYHHSKA